MEVRNIVQEAMTKTIPQKRKARRGNCCLRRLYSSIAKERREVEGKRERERLYPTECTVPKNSKER